MSKSCVEPYLFFGGNCAEALEFYKGALGAEVGMVMKYSESPEPAPPGMLKPGWEDKIMHSSFKVGSSIVMASDGCGSEGGFNAFSLSVTVPDEAAAKAAFEALAEGGEIRMPLGKTFWSASFGMVQDKYGMGWMITVPVEHK